MSVRKYRSVEEMPGPARGVRLDPENLRQAFALAEIAHAMAPLQRPPGIRKFRSWNEALRARELEMVRAASRRER